MDTQRRIALPTPFAIDLATGPEWAELRISGEADIAAVASLEAATASLMPAPPTVACVDLSGLTFLDLSASCAIRALTRALTQAGAQVIVVPPRRWRHQPPPSPFVLGR